MAKYNPEIGQIGSQLNTTFFIFDNCIRNPESVSVQEYERMIDTDETIAVGVQFVILSVLQKLGEYQHSNPKVTEFVQENLESMQSNIYTASQEILTALWAGYSGSEIVWKAEKGRILIDKISTYHPKTIYIKVNRETGEYEGLKQWRWFAGSPIDIPREKAIIYTHNMRFGNYYGKSMLKHVRKNWLLKDPILKMWARALDRFGTPLISIHVPDEQIEDPDHPGEFVNQMEWANRLLGNLQNSTGLVLRSGSAEMGNETKVETVTNGGTSVGQAFESAVNYLNKMMLRGMLVPSLFFDEGMRAGSYALGKTHFSMYNLGVSGIHKSLVEVLIDQVVRRLIEYNFGAQKDYGTFVERDIESEDLETMYKAFVELTNAGYLSSEVQEDFDMVRQKFDLPQRKVETLDEKVSKKAQIEYARYVREDGEDIGDPLAKEDAAGA